MSNQIVMLHGKVGHMATRVNWLTLLVRWSLHMWVRAECGDDDDHSR